MTIESVQFKNEIAKVPLKRRNLKFFAVLNFIEKTAALTVAPIRGIYLRLK
jgi:hypothetical protein